MYVPVHIFIRASVRGHLVDFTYPCLGVYCSLIYTEPVFLSRGTCPGGQLLGCMAAAGLIFFFAKTVSGFPEWLYHFIFCQQHFFKILLLTYLFGGGERESE